MEKEHMRTPILQTLRKSPIAGLEKHFKYVHSGIFALDKTVKSYIDGNNEQFKK